MDQLKEALRQAIKYRFWIAVGISALLPMLAYFMGVGKVQAEAATLTGQITAAEKDVKQYSGGAVINRQYRPLVAEKTEALAKDVQVSWKKLYARQAPLLKWPERVHDKFTAWGRKWPENVDASQVQFAIIDYVNAYPGEVTKVYKSFHPFDPTDGTGVVAAPPEEALLRPAKFTIESPPALGKVWAAQERLWVQGTLLDVVAQVNKGAKDWDAAVIKQVDGLEVGSAAAQDQRSMAKGDTLEEAPAIDDPAKPPAEEAAAPEMGGMMGPMMGMMGGAAANTETVSYIKPEGENAPYKIMPVQLTVLIDQAYIQDLLVALENSPMTIQVKDFEMSKPTAKVTKPQKGVGMGMGYGMMGMGGGMADPRMMMMMMGNRGMSGFGGRASMMDPSMMMMMSGAYGMGGATSKAAKGKDVRAVDRQKEARERLEAATKGSGNSLHDPYFNIVQVKVTGQARFFNPPPPDEAAPESQADAATPEGETKADAAKAEDMPKADAKTEAETKADTPKAEGEPKAEAKGYDAKGEPKAEAKGDDAPKSEPKGEDAKAEPRKAEGDPKAEPKAEAPTGADAPKAEAEPKAEAPKAEATPKK